MESRLTKILCAVGGTVVAIAALATAVRAGEPFVGVDVGMAAPTGTFRRTADVGGAVAPYAGYRLLSGQSVAFSLVVQPQFAGFPTNVPFGKGRQSDATTIFSGTAGPRLSLLDEHVEAFFSAQGGYYTDCTGPLDSGGGGWNIAGGFNYEFNPGDAAGLYLRYDDAMMRASRKADGELTFVGAGLGYEHRFLPAPVAVAAAPAPPPPPPPPAAPMKKKIVLRGVNFDFDKSTIRPDAKATLDEAVATLKEQSNINIAVEGHTDSVGTDAYNQKLSMRRAQAVKDYLAQHGISADRMTTEGFGESRPVASNDTEDGRAQNRRVELRISNE